MNKKDYQNTIGLQIEDLRTLAGIQAEKCFDRRKLESLLDRTAYQSIQRVVMSGCGDSYSAVGAMRAAFQTHSGLEYVDTPDPMEFCRFYSTAEITKRYTPQETLVIAVSASGSADRIVEILSKGNSTGAHTMLISNNPESKGAKAARYLFNVETPAGCNSPGLRSYFASMIAVTALGAYIGLAQGHISEARFDEIKESVASCVKEFMTCYDRIDDQMFELAQAWKTFERFEVIGDWNEAFSAQFVEEKIIECAGVHCTHADSEDWCHINYHLRNPQSVGTVFIVNAKAPDFDRMVYTVRSAVDVQRPVLVVTDAEKKEFPAQAVVCRLPAVREAWLSPLVDFAPGSMLGAYVAAVSGKLFFGGRYDYRTQKWIV